MGKGNRNRSQRITGNRETRQARQYLRDLNTVLQAGNAGIISGGGIYQPLDQRKTHKSLDSLMKTLKPGEHLWMMVASYHVNDPAKLYDPNHTQHFDMENLIASEVGCFKCEQGYTPEIASRPCVEVS